MRRFGVTHASGTPTFWRFLLAELRTDGEPAPRLEQVTLGGEAMPSAVVGALRKTFPRARISQLYAATEWGSASVSATARSGCRSASSSEADGEAQFRIVDGELWVRSRSSMLGYYDEEPVPDDGWRPTGDLVELVGDRIHFLGRAIEIINVGGVKVHPLPIEERVAGARGRARPRARPAQRHDRPDRRARRRSCRWRGRRVHGRRHPRGVRRGPGRAPPAQHPFVETLVTHGGKMLRGRTP